MANPFGGPSATGALFTGMASSIMDSLKSEHEKRQEEEKRSKEMDYQLLMAALEKLQPNLTPSQASEILTRGVDIFKPKGHGGIKENIKEIFGGGQPYEMQGGKIIQDVMSKPRLNVKGPDIAGSGAPATFPNANITLPPPPVMHTTHPELTYREQEMADEAQKQELILKRQTAMEDEREKHRQADIKLRTDEAVRKVAATLPMQEQWKAQRKVSEKAYQIAASTGRSVDDPEVIKQAAEEIQYEAQMRKEDHMARLENYKQRNEKMKADIAAANARIDIARQRLSTTNQKSYKELPQIKQADAEIQRLMNESQRTRILASQAWGNYAADGNAQWKRQAEQLDAEADKYETEAKTKVALKESYIEWYEGTGAKPGGVKLPNAPGRSKGAAKLTEAEIRAGGGGDAAVKRARERGLLAQ